MPSNFTEKTFVDGSQTSKSAKVFSLESFPLYSKFLDVNRKLIQIKAGVGGKRKIMVPSGVARKFF